MYTFEITKNTSCSGPDQFGHYYFKEEISAATPSQLGTLILAARAAAGLSQSELAVKLKTSPSNIGRLERGRSIPSTTTLARIAKATGHKLTITMSMSRRNEDTATF
jgi:ribosome-binding protein aMBF1 (putative translation factor)